MKEASDFFFGEELSKEARHKDDHYDGEKVMPVAGGIAGGLAGATLPRSLVKHPSQNPFGTGILGAIFGYQAGKFSGQAISEKIRNGEVDPRIIDNLLLSLGTGIGGVGGALVGHNAARNMSIPSSTLSSGGMLLGSTLGTGVAHGINRMSEEHRERQASHEELMDELVKVAKEKPAYLHSGELLEFNVENDKALEREKKYKERLRRLKERRTGITQ